jgi:hypothetical protein
MYKYLCYTDDNILVEMEDPLNYAAYVLSEKLLPSNPIVPVTVDVADGKFLREFVGAKPSLGIDVPRNERAEALLVLDYLLGVPVRSPSSLIVDGVGAVWGVDYQGATLAPVTNPASALYTALPEVERDMGLDTCLMGSGYGSHRVRDMMIARVEALEYGDVGAEVEIAVREAAERLISMRAIRWFNGDDEVAERRMVDRYGTAMDRNALEADYQAFNAMLQAGQAEVDSDERMTLTFYVFDHNERAARDVAAFSLGDGVLRLEGEQRIVRALARRVFNNRVPDDPVLAFADATEFYSGQLVQAVVE